MLKPTWINYVVFEKQCAKYIMFNELGCLPRLTHLQFFSWHWNQIKHFALFFHSPGTQLVGSDLD